MQAPVHQGRPARVDAVGAVGNPACGDVVTLYLTVEDGRVQATFDSLGSPYQLATASVLCDCVAGRTLAHARELGPGCLEERLPDLPQRVRYLSRLAIEALGRALDAYERGDDPSAGGPPPVDDAAATAYVLELLADEVPRSAADLATELEEAGHRLPRSLLRLLADLRASGQIEGELKGTQWRWWRTAGVA